MSKRCAKCEKIVYPTEELKCLDKTWHKACFRCTECNMALNMKNYKGYDKKPYCNAHYPTTKHTQVAETPENRRLAQNTKIQSNAKYHEDFEKNIKGSKIQVSDDPETLRHKANTSVVSNVEYSGHKERFQEMEQRRGGLPRAPANNGGVPMRKNPTYPMPTEPNVASPYSDRNQGHSTAYTTEGKVEQSSKGGRVGSIHDYDPMNERFGSLNTGYNPQQYPGPQQGQQGQQQWQETVNIPNQNRTPAEPNTPPPSHQPEQKRQSKIPIGGMKIPYVPTDQPIVLVDHKRDSYHYPAPQPSHPPQSYEPVRRPDPAPMQPAPQPQAPAQPPPEPEPPAPQQAPPHGSTLSSPVFQAMYDYDAQDDDEISFIDGDLLIECQQIDDGWMFGTVRRTGARGMLPANYVERVQ